MKQSKSFAALISFTFASASEGNGENIGAVRRDRASQSRFFVVPFATNYCFR